VWVLLLFVILGLNILRRFWFVVCWRFACAFVDFIVELTLFGVLFSLGVLCWFVVGFVLYILVF